MPREVRIGGVAKPELLQRLRAGGIQLNRAAEALFEDDRFVPLGQSEVVEIAVRSVAELGFDQGATLGQLVARARESGLMECPLELGPHLRMQFLDQREGAAGHPATRGRVPPGTLTVVSRPLDDLDQTPKGFYLRRIDGDLWLRGYWSSPDYVWIPDALLVFAVDRGRAPSPAGRRPQPSD